MRRTRAQQIQAYGAAYDQLIAAVEQLPREMWLWQPGPGRWSVHELLIHITDSEANSYVRARRCIAEPGTTVTAYDEMRWSDALHYLDQDVDEALELFRLLRLRTYWLIQHLPEAAWKQTIEHPENGTMTLQDWLDVYERHIPEHIEQMEENYRAWLARRA